MNEFKVGDKVWELTVVADDIDKITVFADLLRISGYNSKEDIYTMIGSCWGYESRNLFRTKNELIDSIIDRLQEIKDE